MRWWPWTSRKQRERERAATQAQIAPYLQAFKDADRGEHENLLCPDCGEHSVGVWYTNLDGQYRMWAICRHCRYENRAHCTGRPPGFTPDRVCPKLCERDRQIFAHRKFPPPE